MKVLVVDDEPLARARLRSMLNGLADIEVVGEAGNGREAFALAQSTGAETVLLDIRMPGMDGLETARHLARLTPPPAVIFTTAFDEHALAAFDASAIDYLLKPVRDQRLQEALRKAERLLQGPTQQPAALVRDAPRHYLSVSSRQGVELIAVEDIHCFRADHKYVSVFHPGGETLTEESLRQLEDEFAERFIRIHRNALVARDRIQTLIRDADGRHLLRLSGCAIELEVSRRHIAELKRLLRSI